MIDPERSEDGDAPEPKSGGRPGIYCFCPRCKKDVEPRERLRWVAKLERIALCQLCPSCDGVLHVSA